MVRQILIIFIVTFTFPHFAFAGCNETYLGATPKNPIFSTVDIILSPTYSGATTSGTSACPNWDFAELLDQTRTQFLVVSYPSLLENITQNEGVYLNAFVHIMGCPKESRPSFTKTLKKHYYQLPAKILNRNDSRKFLKSIKLWIQQNPELVHHCRAVS